LKSNCNSRQYVVIKLGTTISKNRWILFGAANLGYAGLLIFYAGNSLEIDRTSSFGVLMALLIIGSASLDLNDSPKFSKILTYLGDASYSIFLLQNPTVSAITKVLQNANLGKYLDTLLPQLSYY
jgi:exopolysaccharide production protein ExoZ